MSDIEVLPDVADDLDGAAEARGGGFSVISTDDDTDDLTDDDTSDNADDASDPEASLEAALPPGTKCMRKVIQVEEIVYDTELQCTHVDEQECYQVYQTVFKSVEV